MIGLRRIPVAVLFVHEFLAGTPVELIMKISGHKSTKDFYKYIRITPEEAALKIKEIWMKRDGMRLVQNAGKVVSNKDITINQ